MSVFESVDTFESNRPGFDDQDPSRQKQLIRNTIKMMTSTTGVFVLRLSVAELRRLKSDKTDASDPLKQAITTLDDIFKDCKHQLVDTSSSLNAIVDAHDRDKQSNGAVFLAWDMEPRANPQLIGIAVCTKFIPHADFSTEADAMGADDYSKLEPYFGNHLLIDTLCSKKKGVGRILILHVYEYAHRKNYRGVVALSYSRRKLSPSVRPASERSFRDLAFQPIVNEASFEAAMYGVWFKKSTFSEEGLNSMILSLCTRQGLTRNAVDKLIWRCPT